jgi:hypothetical protein
MAIRFHLLLLLGTAVRAHAQAPAFDEYQVKAVFLYNFATKTASQIFPPPRRGGRMANPIFRGPGTENCRAGACRT